MPRQVSILSSMATKGLLTELAAAWDGHADLDAVGGVDAARRMHAGEVVDVVVLAGGAMRQLEAAGLLLPGSLVGIAVSGMAIAVRENEKLPALSDADAVRRAVLDAPRTGYSTGPSGDHLLRLLQDWGIRDQLGSRLVQAPPGIPVGRLLVEGAVDLAVQQRSELMGMPGVVIAGPLPPSIQVDTVFTAGIACSAQRPDAARSFIDFMALAQNAEAKRRNGMEPP